MRQLPWGPRRFGQKRRDGSPYYSVGYDHFAFDCYALPNRDRCDGFGSGFEVIHSTLKIENPTFA
jgi:hypothetical protein